MKRAVAIAPEETFYVVSDLPPSRTQKRLALAVVLFTSVIALVVMGPLSGVRLRPVAAFLPMYLMAMFVIDSLTAVLLFAQFAISRSPAMHVLATGYVFTAITVIPYSLTFPGVFAPESVIGDLQSTACRAGPDKFRALPPIQTYRLVIATACTLRSSSPTPFRLPIRLTTSCSA